MCVYIETAKRRAPSSSRAEPHNRSEEPNRLHSSSMTADESPHHRCPTAEDPTRSRIWEKPPPQGGNPATPPAATPPSRARASPKPPLPQEQSPQLYLLCESSQRVAAERRSSTFVGRALE